ncbi:MAG: type II secretion system protein [Planctomycetota bacterium]|nr:type II secretion system protein [Planctomycetota bacterium]
MRTKSSTARTGFTLVELLVVITIIGLMSGMFLIAYQGAALESRKQKTLATINKLSEVLNSRMEEYASYSIVLRLPMPPIGTGEALPPNAVPLAANNPLETKTFLLERTRLLCLREIIAMEMPDHPDDIKWTDKWVSSSNNATFFNTMPKQVATGLTAGASQSFVQNRVTARTKGIAKKLSNASSSGFLPIPGWQNANANAELLYLIIEDSQLNGSSAIELFGASETADLDKDGLKEFIDAFGRPIQWIRWPTGFEGVARYHPDMLDPGIITGTGSNVRVTIESDPLDRMGADPGYKTTDRKPGPGAFPLVVSSGPDRRFGIRFQLSSQDAMIPVLQVSRNSDPKSYSVTDSIWSGLPIYMNADLRCRYTDPWYPRVSSSGTPARLGGRLDSSIENLFDSNGIPIDFNEDPTEPIDWRYSRDNITNYDGNGASL